MNRTLEPSVNKTLTALAGFICLIAALAVPIVYFLSGWSHESSRLTREAQWLADTVAVFAYGDAELSRLDDNRIREIMQRHGKREQPGLWQVFDANDRLLGQAGVTPARPTITSRSRVESGAAAVGSARIVESLRPLLWRTGSAAIAGLIVAAIAFAALRRLPFQSLREAFGRLGASNEALAEELRNKEAALRIAEELRAAIRHQAFHDDLTQLPNRALFHDRLRQAIRSARRENRMLAVFYMDLNRFKEINDTRGHDVGDRVLQAVAVRMTGTLRDSDTVARMGGDEFAMLLPSVVDREGVVIAANRVQRAIKQPVIIHGSYYSIGVSLGVALFPEHGEEVATLLRCADVAMYGAKRERREFAFYDAKYELISRERDALQSDLRRALDERDLVLHYQPKVSLESGRVKAAEALVRWPHRELGLLHPDSFISLAQQAGVMEQLTMLVLTRAIEQCAEWRARGFDLGVSVNVSAADLQNAEFPTRVRDALVRSGIPAPALEVEVTEGAIMSEPERAIENITRLKAMGVAVCIDDFGAGYSSFVHLKRLPVTRIKIDKSFVIDMAKGESEESIVRSVIVLGQGLRCEVVAEGVETRAVWDRLKLLGCDSAQGYFMARPMPQDAFQQWLVESPWAATGAQGAPGGGPPGARR